jgi:DNA processing protein
MDQGQARDLLVLADIPGIGPARFRSLVSHFGTASAVLAASPREFPHVEGIDRRIAETITQFCRGSARKAAERDAQTQLARMQKSGGRIVSLWEAEYPPNLKKIYDAPPFLFLRGSFESQDNYSVAIVGTREPTPYGIQIAERFATDLSNLGLPVVSGLARGVDTSAHGAALKAGGRTIAVIGSGIDVIYPPENSSLADRVAAQGALVSEYLMGTKPDAGNFPRRNRIISGITLATLVIETGTQGGAMITAAMALDQNREVFAIPSALHPRRQSGTNLLIKEGKAKLTETVDDIIAELAPRLTGVLASRPTAPAPVPPDLTLFERQLYDAMTDDPMHIDLIAERAGMKSADALVYLLTLEFKGSVRQMAGKMFLRR